MKKYLTLALSLIMVLSLAACGGKESNPVVNPANEAWVCKEINMSYIFNADGTYKSYAGDPWRENGDGKYKFSNNSVDLDDQKSVFAFKDDTLKTSAGRVYVRTTPFELNTGDTTSSNSNGEYHGNTKGANDLKNVTDKNYKDVAKSIFGIEIKDVSGLELESAESPNGVNNLNITYKGSNLEDAKSTLQYYFDKCKSLSNDGIYSIKVNYENYSVGKDTKYEDFETFYEAKATKMDTLYKSQWIYDNNGKNIQFTISIGSKQTNISFVLLG